MSRWQLSLETAIVVSQTAQAIDKAVKSLYGHYCWNKTLSLHENNTVIFYKIKYWSLMEMGHTTDIKFTTATNDTLQS